MSLEHGILCPLCRSSSDFTAQSLGQQKLVGPCGDIPRCINCFVAGMTHSHSATSRDCPFFLERNNRNAITGLLIWRGMKTLLVLRALGPCWVSAISVLPPPLLASPQADAHLHVLMIITLAVLSSIPLSPLLGRRLMAWLLKFFQALIPLLR